MVSAAAFLGLRAPQPGFSTPCRAPYYLVFHFVFAYGLLSSRTLKQYLGIDNMNMPREDIRAGGDAAVKSGKITQAQLDMVKRNDAAHYNSVENYTLLVAGLLSAQRAGISNHIINRAALIYTGARFAYAVVYILISDPKLALMRGVTWWIGNLSCLYLLWQSGKSLAV